MIRKFEFRDFNDLTQIGRSWEMPWAAVKEYRVPPPPESSFLPEFAYRAENTPAAHKRTSASAISEAETPPRNSGGPHLRSRNPKGQGNTDGNDSRNKGHPMGFPRNRPKKSEETRSPKNSRIPGQNLRWGEVNDALVRPLKKPLRTLGPIKRLSVFDAKNLAISKQAALYRGS